MRILEVVDTMRIESGITNVLLNYAKNINKENCKLEFLTIDADAKVVSLINDNDCEIYYMPNAFHNPFKWYFFIKNYFKNHKERQYDVVHSHCFQFDRILFHIAKNNGVKKCISHSHSSKKSDSILKAKISDILTYNLYKKSDICLACSENAGKCLYGIKGMNSNKFHIARNGIDVIKYKFNEENRKKYRNQYNLGGSLVIGHVGNFQKTKNHKFLIEILQILCERGIDCKLLLVGKTGPTFEEIKKKVKDMKLEEKVVFTGTICNVNEVLCAMDIFVLPSNHEGFSIASLEAQAVGLPVLISDGLPREVGVYNFQFLSLEKSANEWADEIMKMVNLKINRYDVCNRIIDCGFDAKSTAKYVEKIYMEEKI